MLSASAALGTVGMTFCDVGGCLGADVVHPLLLTFPACVLPVAVRLSHLTLRNLGLLPVTALFPQHKGLIAVGFLPLAVLGVSWMSLAVPGGPLCREEAFRGDLSF